MIDRDVRSERRGADDDKIRIRKIFRITGRLNPFQQDAMADFLGETPRSPPICRSTATKNTIGFKPPRSMGPSLPAPYPSLRDQTKPPASRKIPENFRGSMQGFLHGRSETIYRSGCFGHDFSKRGSGWSMIRRVMIRGTTEAAWTAKHDPAATQPASPLPDLSQVSGAWVGASAFGVEAFAALAEALPDGAGKAFDPASHRIRSTRRRAASRPRLTASCASGIPRNACLAVGGGFLTTEPAPKGRRLVMGIDSLQLSLADKRKNPSIGVSLPATGDGTPATARNTG